MSRKSDYNDYNDYNDHTDQKNNQDTRNTKDSITAEFITRICTLYGDSYDDTKEDSSIKGSGWKPGKKAEHKSLRAFQKELWESYNIKLSTSKIRKILITGGIYSTELSRSVNREYERYETLPDNKRVQKVAEVLNISPSTVYTYLPYDRMAYKMDKRSENARSLSQRRLKEKVYGNQYLEDEMVGIVNKISGVLTPDEISMLLKFGPDRLRLLLDELSSVVEDAESSSVITTSASSSATERTEPKEQRTDKGKNNDMNTNTSVNNVEAEKAEAEKEAKTKKYIRMVRVSTNNEAEAKKFLDHYNIEWKMRKNRDIGIMQLVAAVPAISRIMDEINDCQHTDFNDHMQEFRDRDGNSIIVMNPYMDEISAKEELEGKYKGRGFEIAPYSIYGNMTPSIVKIVKKVV